MFTPIFFFNSRLLGDYQGLSGGGVYPCGVMSPEKESNPDVDRVTSPEMICAAGSTVLTTFLNLAAVVS